MATDELNAKLLDVPVEESEQPTATPPRKCELKISKRSLTIPDHFRALGKNSCRLLHWPCCCWSCCWVCRSQRQIFRLELRRKPVFFFLFVWKYVCFSACVLLLLFFFDLLLCLRQRLASYYAVPTFLEAAPSPIFFPGSSLDLIQTNYTYHVTTDDGKHTSLSCKCAGIDCFNSGLFLFDFLLFLRRDILILFTV